MEQTGLKVSVSTHSEVSSIVCEGIADNSNIKLLLSTIQDVMSKDIHFINISMSNLKYADRHMILLLKNYMEYHIWIGGEIILENAPMSVINDIEQLGMSAYFDIEIKMKGNIIRMKKVLTIEQSIDNRIKQLKEKIEKYIY